MDGEIARRRTSRLERGHVRARALARELEAQPLEIRRVDVPRHLHEPQLVLPRRRLGRQGRFVDHALDGGGYILFGGLVRPWTAHGVVRVSLGRRRERRFVGGERSAAPSLFLQRSVGGRGRRWNITRRPATADQTPARSRARFASTSSALAHSERRRRTRVRPSLRSHHAASSRSRVVPRGRGALGARGGLRPRGRARPPRRSGWILRLAQVLPGRGEPRRVRGIQGEEARVRRHRTGRHRRAQLQHRRDRCVPRAIPDRSLRSRSPAECVLP